MQCRPNQMCIEAFVDADFASAWTSENSHKNLRASHAMVHAIKVANCPTQWVGKMQTEVVLSMTDAEC